MSYIKFDKSQLVNLEYSLTRELVRSNRAGSYASTTIVGCNTRKYHGLLITPQPQLDGGMHVLLSSLDETVIQHNKEFNLGIHLYKGGKASPGGHKYIVDYNLDPTPIITYKVGGVKLTKELIFVSNSDTIIFKYKLLEAHSETMLRFRPFLAFRNANSLSKSNPDVDYRYEQVANGIRLRMYMGYPHIYMQLSKENEFVPNPHWYYDFEYFQEQRMGFEYLEDLYTPGYFDVPIKKGESIYFVASLQKENPKLFPKIFANEINRRVVRDSFENNLQNAAHQFIIKRGNKTEIIAGFPWFGRVARDTFISLPGLTLVQGIYKTFREIVDFIISEMRGPFFPNFGTGDKMQFDSVDGSLWFFWALQQYIIFGGQAKTIWTRYSDTMKLILNSFREGTWYNIHAMNNGLLYAGEHGKAITWMDAVVDGIPVTPRVGLPVEVNALWYNAICFLVELAEKMGDKKTVEQWKPIADKIPEAFVDAFWYEEKKYLYDYVHGDFADRSVRPNQLFAVSLPYSPLNEDQQKTVLDTIKSELLTTRGIRTLAPKNKDYHPEYKGTQRERDLAYHQGSVFPWLFGNFADAWLKLHGKSGLALVKRHYDYFKETIDNYGVGTICELYDGDPPHRDAGAISQAWSVAELLRVKYIIDKFEDKDKKDNK